MTYILYITRLQLGERNNRHTYINKYKPRNPNKIF